MKSPFSKFTLAPFGFFTSALGFVFLSGLVAGIVAQKKEEKPLKQLTRTYHLRAKTIYRHHVITFIVLSVVGLLFFYHGIKLSPFNSFELTEPVISKMALGVVLLNRPRFLDILPMYFFFMLALPTIIKYIRMGKVLFVLFLSAGIYALAQLFNTYHIQAGIGRDYLVELGYFDILAWQFIFVMGVILGILYEKGLLGFLKNKKVLLTTGAVIIASSILRRATLFQYASISEMGSFFYDFARFNISNLGQLSIIHLVNFSFFALLLFNLIQYKIINLSNKWLVLLGQHSLHVFTLHIFLVYIGLTVKGQIKNAVVGMGFTTIDIIITVVSILLMFLYVQYYSKKQITIRAKTAGA